MLDPTRYALDAATVGFRKRMGLEVHWDAFHNAIENQTNAINVRRELEETKVTELHVMGGQRYGLEGNSKTNELARQKRQMNGYPLRSFLATGGAVILPLKSQDRGVMATPMNMGLTSYAQYNGVVGNYVSKFVQPLWAPLENNTQLLGRTGQIARSESASDPYKALQFQMNLHTSLEDIRRNEANHQTLRGYNRQDQQSAIDEAANARGNTRSGSQPPAAPPQHPQSEEGRVILQPPIRAPVAARQEGATRIITEEDLGNMYEGLQENRFPQGSGEEDEGGEGNIGYLHPSERKKPENRIEQLRYELEDEINRFSGSADLFEYEYAIQEYKNANNGDEPSLSFKLHEARIVNGKPGVFREKLEGQIQMKLMNLQLQRAQELERVNAELEYAKMGGDDNLLYNLGPGGSGTQLSSDPVAEHMERVLAQIAFIESQSPPPFGSDLRILNGLPSSSPSIGLYESGATDSAFETPYSGEHTGNLRVSRNVSGAKKKLNFQSPKKSPEQKAADVERSAVSKRKNISLQPTYLTSEHKY